MSSDEIVKDFTLIDLTTQADAVARIISGWSSEQILAWLNQNGTVEHVQHPYDQHLYRFCSTAGIVTGLRITDDGEVYIVTSHTIRRLGQQ
jgi:hypothetical protein